jgi:hypothetical protein
MMRKGEGRDGEMEMEEERMNGNMWNGMFSGH